MAKPNQLSPIKYQSEPEPEPDALQLRDTSGMHRGLGAWDVFVFNVLGYATGLSLATNPTFLGALYPTANIYWTLFFGLVLSLFFGWSYGMFAAMYPVTGGDYKYISRALAPGIGFVASWGFTWSQIYGIGVFSEYAIRDSLSPALLLYGYISHSQRMVQCGLELATTMGKCVGGLIVLALCILCSLIEQRYLKNILTFLFIIAMFSAALMATSFLSVKPSEFQAEFDRFMAQSGGGAHAYDNILALAHGAGLKKGYGYSIWNSLRALPVGFLIFFGFTYSVYVGGEVREPERSQTYGVLAALAVAGIFSFVGMGSYFHALGQDFNTAIAIAKNMTPSPLPAGGSMVFFAGILIKHQFSLALMAFGSFIWFFLLPLVMIILSVRNIFAWSVDGAIPQLFSRVASGNRPIPAIVAVGVFASLFLLADALMGFPYVNYTLLFSVCFCITGIAGAVVPFRKKTQSDFALAPALVRAKLGDAYIFCIASLISAVMFAFLVWSALTNRDFSGVSAGKAPSVLLVLIYGAGVVVWRSKKPRPTGPTASASKLYRNLPPR